MARLRLVEEAGGFDDTPSSSTTRLPPMARRAEQRRSARAEADDQALPCWAEKGGQRAKGYELGAETNLDWTEA